VLQVWKQKGEEYRITGQGGWYWVSVSRPSTPVPASILGLRLVAGKLQARKLKQLGVVSDELDDQKPSPAQVDKDEKPSVADIGCSEPDSKAAESKLESELVENEGATESEAVKEEERVDDVKESVKCETGDTCSDEAGECKLKLKKDESVNVSDVVENLTDVGETFSVSEALISRTFFPRITKPYSKLDAFLDRRLLQYSAEQKQRVLCEQLIAQYRAQQASAKKPPLSAKSGKPEVSTEGESDVTWDADSIVKSDPTSTAAAVDQCYSPVCRSAGETVHAMSCYSAVCRRCTFSAKSDFEQLHSGSDQLKDFSAEASKEDSISSASTLSTDDVRDPIPQVGITHTAESDPSSKNDILLPKAESNSVPAAENKSLTCAESKSVVNSLSADTTQNCMMSARKSRSRVSRKKASAIVAGRSKSFANSDKAAPSLSLQKYTQDGKIHLTAELVKELEDALAVCGQTQHKVSLVRRAGPGRPPTKSTSQLSGIQKKLSLPPVHRFMSGRSSKRSLFALERNFLTTLARREGRWECPGFNYACKMTNVGWPYPCPRPLFRTAWKYRTQTLLSIAGAAVQLRVLWACIRWDDIKAHVPPGGTNTVTTDLDITTTELLKKRDLPPHSLRSEYLVRKIVVPINVPASQSRGEFCLLYINTWFLFCLQCFDAVGWAAGRASGL